MSAARAGWSSPTRIRFGGDYNPEQHPERVWVEDVRLMREARVDLVNVGVFAWSWLEPADGEFDFSGMDRVLDLLHAAGIGVGLGTATASPPPWLTHAHPEILPRTADGTVLGPGSRQHYAPSSPVFRRYAARLTGAVAERYARHPAVRLWHVGNEYGCHVPIDCSDAAASAFRVWLEERYTSVDALNEAWGTMFWSHRYRSFDEVQPPARMPHIPNPGHLLDFRRFSSDALLECFLMEKRIIRAAGGEQPVTTNLIGPFPTIDFWRWAPHLDIVSVDCYPDLGHPDGFREAAFHCDLARSLAGDKPWLRMEASPEPAAGRAAIGPRDRGLASALAWQAVGRGADGIQFFQWRQSSAGAERFHPAMVPHAGTDTHTWAEMTRLGAELASFAPPVGSDADGARVAVVLDVENWWALEAPDLPVRVDFSHVVQRWYRALHAAHIAVDLVPSTADLSSYRLVIAPQLFLLSDSAAEGLRRFAEAGGVLFVGAYSDVVDESGRIRDGGHLRGLGETLGVGVAGHFALALRDAAASVPVEGSVAFAGESLVEDVRPMSGTEVVSRFGGGRFVDRPALTRVAVGEGSAWYAATIPDAAGTATLVARMLADARVSAEVPGLPASVEFMRRGELVTLIAHGEQVTVDLRGWETLDGRRLADRELVALDVLHMRRAAVAGGER